MGRINRGADIKSYNYFKIPDVLEALKKNELTTQQIADILEIKEPNKSKRAEIASNVINHISIDFPIYENRERNVIYFGWLKRWED